jgi:hypothetical protein
MFCEMDDDGSGTISLEELREGRHLGGESGARNVMSGAEGKQAAA